MRDRKELATALRRFAEYIEEDDTFDPSQLRAADDIADIVARLEEKKADDEFDAEALEAARDWREREARGEKAIPSADVRRILGL